jgi:hypothetical protein
MDISEPRALVVVEMFRTSSLQEACHELFLNYPMAARSVNHSAAIRSMVVMRQDGGNTGFFVLSDDRRKGAPSYSLYRWPMRGNVDIQADDDLVVSEVFVDVVTHGIPIPRDGSLFGWTCEGAITALIVIYAEHTPACPEPAWAVMPCVGTPEAQWPPFTGKRLFGHWSWVHYRAGSIVSLGGLISANPGKVFWTDTTAALGSHCCTVERDIQSPKGYVLRRGRYVYYQVLRAGKPVPPLEELLANTSKIDLASRFQWLERSHDWRGDGGTWIQ